MLPPNPVLLKASGVCLRYPSAPVHGTSWRDEFVRWLSPGKGLSSRQWTPVLSELDLEVRRGDRILLLGANGAGKTTLARCLTGMIPPDRGLIEKRSSTAIVPLLGPAAWALPELTAEENTTFLAQVYGLSAVEARKAAARALEFASVMDRRARPIREFSRGMQAKLWLSLILELPLGSDSVLILDEVSGGEDVRFRERWFARLDAAPIGALVWISHSTELLAPHLERGWVMDQGRIACDGTLAEARACYLAGGTR